MDYGKVSYYKTEELERRLNGGRFNAVTINRGELPAGQTTTVATLKGKGLLTVRIKAASGVHSTVYAGGAEAGSGDGDYTIAVAAQTGAVAVLPQGGVAAATVTVAGWGVGLTAAE